MDLILRKVENYRELKKINTKEVYDLYKSGKRVTDISKLFEFMRFTLI